GGACGGMVSWVWRGAEVFLVPAFAIFVVLGGGAERLVARRPLWLSPACALCVWAALQLVPLPPRVLGVVSPGALRRLSAAVPGFGSTESGGLLSATLAEAARTIPAGLPPAPAPPP